MNAPSRKTPNQTFKREFSYPSHQASSAAHQDGMTVTGTSIALSTVGTASVPSVAQQQQQQQQHTASYLQGSSLPGQSPHIQTQSYHLPHGSASSGQPALISTQGPPPATTPPSVPNETKGPGSLYQSFSHTMNQHHPLPLRGMVNPYPQVLQNNNAQRVPQHQPRATYQSLQRNHVYLNSIPTGAHSVGAQYSVNMVPGLITSGNTAAALQAAPNYQLPTSAGGEVFLMPSPSYPYNYPVRGATAWTTQSTRGTPQNLVSVGPNSQMLPSSQPYIGMSQVAPVPPQQMQHNAPAASTLKPRTKTILKIQDPITLKEINIREDEDKDTAKSEKRSSFANDVKRASESSSTACTSSANPPTFVPKEQNQSALNGTASSVPFVPPTSDWKMTPTGAPSSLYNPVDDSSNSGRLFNAPTKFPSPPPVKREPKKPEENNKNDAQSHGSNTPITSSWPETPPFVSPTIAAPSQQATVRASPAGSKKSPKEAESSVPVSTGHGTPSIPTPVVSSGDGANKTTNVTTPAGGLTEESDVVSKKAKQGIHGGGNAAKESAPSVKVASGKPSAAIVSPTGQSLPETSPTGGPVVTAQISVTKAEVKPQTGVPQHTVVQSSSSGASVITGVKPPANAISTSGPVSEKLASVTASSTANDSSPKATSASNTSPSRVEKSQKDDKANPSTTKADARGKKPNDSNAAKTGPSVPKHHGADVSKPSVANVPSSNSLPAKTNGEADQSVASEGKSKKKKGPNKKELNKKGQEKEGSDMDIFTEIKPSEKSVRAEKSPPSNSQPSQPLTANANANNRSRTNSSQKTENGTSNNSHHAKENVISPENIPNVPAAPANKTSEAPSAEYDRPTAAQCAALQRRYSVNEMLAMRNLPQCKRVPTQVNYWPVMLTSPGGPGPRGMSQNGYNVASNAFLPQFANPGGGGSMSMIPRNKSQQGNTGGGRGKMLISVHLKGEVHLRRSEDAWKPTVLSNDRPAVVDKDGKPPVDLNKSARGILNKLTPEKFDTLMTKFKALPIDHQDKLKGIIDLIFEKAVDEPGFCRWYAEMCRVMQDFSVNDEKDAKSSFRTLLLNNCQKQFESARTEEEAIQKEKKAAEACTDPEQRKELLAQFEEKERKARRKSVGNCRFIGELFKLKMLTPKIMVSCVRVLIQQLEEESLECLCKLLTTTGRELDGCKDQGIMKELEVHFKRLQEIIDPKKKEKISSRIRFMILDVLELRKNKWVPRRETDNPKTIDQMNSEMERKENEQKLASMTMRKSYDDYRGNKDPRNKRNDNSSEDSWKTVTSKNSMSKFPNYKFDATKLAGIITTPNTDQKEVPHLGRPQFSGSWRQGSGLPKKQSAGPSMDSGRGSALSQQQFRNVSGGKLTPSSSMERAKPNLPTRDDDTKMSRGGSAQNVHPASRESSMQRTVPPKNASQSAPTPAPAPSISPLTDEQIRQYSDTILKEFIDNQSTKDVVIDFTERFKSEELRLKSLEKLIESVLEKPAHIADCGKVITALLRADAVTVQMVVDAASTFLSLAEDLKYDYPKFWEYMASLFCGLPLLDQDCILYNELKTALLGLPDFANEKEKVVAEMDRTKRNSKEYIQQFLSRSINTEDYDKVFGWINENVDNPNNNPNLVQALTDAVCETVLEKNLKTGDEISDKFGRYFKKYIDNKETLELLCLHTIVDYSTCKEHPQGLLLAMFEGLFDSKALSSDSFMQLKASIQSGVVMMNVKTFYDYLENPDPDEP